MSTSPFDALASLPVADAVSEPGLPPRSGPTISAMIEDVLAEPVDVSAANVAESRARSDLMGYAPEVIEELDLHRNLPSTSPDVRFFVGEAMKRGFRTREEFREWFFLMSNTAAQHGYSRQGTSGVVAYISKLNEVKAARATA